MFEKNIHLQSSSKDNKINEIYFYYGTVMDIEDPLDSKRLRVRIKGIDDKVDDNNLPWCTSFLPLNIVTNPKRGEMVKIFFPSKNDLMNRREWCGPVFSSFKNLGYENSRTALANVDSNNVEPSKSLNKTPSAKGAYVEDLDVAFQGRDNTDIIFKDKEVLIRAGKFIFNDRTKVNNINPSYIQLKLSTDGERSTSSMVGDKVILFTHKGSKSFKPFMDEENIKIIIEKAFSAAYAEPIAELFRLFQDFAVNHVHPQNLPPNKSFGKINEIANYDVNKIIAKNIKIN